MAKVAEWKKHRIYYEKQKKIANSILNSAYSKLLSPKATKKAMLQMMLDAGLTTYMSSIHRGDGIQYLIGSLSIKLTEFFLNGKEINSQQFHKALKILKNLFLERGASFEMFDEYRKYLQPIPNNHLSYIIMFYVQNMAIRKLKQECPNFSKFLKILDELDLRDI